MEDHDTVINADQGVILQQEYRSFKEYIPILMYGRYITKGYRYTKSFVDIRQRYSNIKIAPPKNGVSFANIILKEDL